MTSVPMHQNVPSLAYVCKKYNVLSVDYPNALGEFDVKLVKKNYDQYASVMQNFRVFVLDG